MSYKNNHNGRKYRGKLFKLTSKWRKKMKYYIILIGCLLTLGCSANSFKSKQERALKGQLKIELLYGISLNDTKVEVKVVTNGCTKPSSFKLSYNQIDDQTIGVSVMRIKKDFCRKKPELMNVSLNLDAQSLTGKKWKITNSFSTYLRVN